MTDRRRKWVYGAVIFVIAMGAYFGAYLLSIRMGSASVRAVNPGRPVSIVSWRSPIYLEGQPETAREAAKVFFGLAHEIDCLLRPGYWHTHVWTPVKE